MSKSNVPGMNFGTITSFRRTSQQTVRLNTDDVHLVREISGFLELVHNTRIQKSVSHHGTHWLIFPARVQINQPALRVVCWLYGVIADQPQLQ
jgi:hypothetical protein